MGALRGSETSLRRWRHAYAASSDHAFAARQYRDGTAAASKWRNYGTYLIAGLALFLTGCIPGPFVRSGNSGSCPCVASTQAESRTNADRPDNEQAQPPEKPNKPRTLPQALRAYLHCVRTHGWETQDQKENEKSADEKKGGKSSTKDQESSEGPEAAPKQQKDEKKDATQKELTGKQKNSDEGEKKEDEKNEEEKKEE